MCKSQHSSQLCVFAQQQKLVYFIQVFNDCFLQNVKEDRDQVLWDFACFEEMKTFCSIFSWIIMNVFFNDEWFNSIHEWCIYMDFLLLQTKEKYIFWKKCIAGLFFLKYVGCLLKILHLNASDACRSFSFGSLSLKCVKRRSDLGYFVHIILLFTKSKSTRTKKPLSPHLSIWIGSVANQEHISKTVFEYNFDRLVWSLSATIQ